VKAFEAFFKESPIKALRFNFELIRRFALGVIFFTGFTGLVYEVTWHRYLANLIGSQAKAAALILAVFLGGLCLGYVLFGHYSRQRSSSHLVKVCGWTEVGIGIWALLFHFFYSILWNQIGILDPTAKFSLFWDLLICILLVAPPTTLMGGTLPLLTQGLSKDLKDASPLHAKVYAINTGGAFLGCLVGGFLLLPALGLKNTVLLMGLVNFSAGACLIWIGALLKESKFDTEKSSVVERKKITSPSPGSYTPIFIGCFVALLAGFYSISLQVILMRVIGLTMGSSEYAFSMIVAVYILMLALGAWRQAGKQANLFSLWVNQLIIFIGIILVYFLIPQWPYFFHVLRIHFSGISSNFYFYHLFAFVFLSFMLIIPVGAMGSTMPMLFNNVKSKMNHVGLDVGKIYGWNTMGCTLGALLGGFWLFYFFNLDQVIKICLGGIILTVILIFPWKQKSPKVRQMGPILVGLVCLGIIFVFPHWDKKSLGLGMFRYRKPLSFSFKGPKYFYKRITEEHRVLAYKDGPNSTISVVAYHEGPDKAEVSRALFVNGKSDGQTSKADLQTVRLLGHIPGLLHTASGGKAAVVGYGTGITLGSLTLYPNISEVHSIEISPVVQEFAHYFDFANHNASNHPKVKWHIGDAFRVLGGSQEKYAIITSQPSNPWVTGVERLYSRDFYELVGKSLEKGGVYAQWLQIYSISKESIQLVLKTFSSVFPHIHTFYLQHDLILLGSKQPFGGDSLDNLRERFHLPSIQKELHEVGLRSPEDILMMERFIPARFYRNSKHQSLEFPKLAYMAGKDFFMGYPLKLHDYIFRKEAQPWIRNQQQNSLLNLWFEWNREKRTKTLKNIAKISCGNKKAQFVPLWQQKSDLCQKSLVALSVQGSISPAYGFTPLMAKRLRELREQKDFKKKISKLSSPREVLVYKDLYLNFESIFLPLSPLSLIELGKTCYRKNTLEYLQCRTQVIHFLSGKDFGDLARKEYTNLLQDAGELLPAQIKNELDQFVSEAEKRSKSST